MDGDSSGYYLAGDINKWNPRDADYRFLQSGTTLLLQLPFADSLEFEYKITRGEWTAAESDRDGYPGGNRKIKAVKDTVITVNVVGWTDKTVRRHTFSPNVQLLSDNFPMTALSSSTSVWIYLPSSYQRTKKYYPVIYMQDGQNLFDRATTSFGTEWKADETMDSLIAAGRGEYIIVGIGSGKERSHEYLPYHSKVFTEPRGKEYDSFMVHQLIPYIDKHYRTLKSPAGRSMVGSSMGALISLYSVMKHPNIFGAAGVFSCSYQVIEQFQDSLFKDPGGNTLKIFLYAGDRESKTLVAYTEQMKKKLQQNPRIKLRTLYVKGGQHSEYFWQQPFREYLLWLQR